jgi:predicted MFS family arabinose efflux permease
VIPPLRRLRATLLGAAVALAFADSSIVVLALPELLERFDASIAEVAWVVTSYNVAVAAVALALVRLGRRIDPLRLTRWGVLVFLASSLACTLAPSLWALVAFRSVQGFGGAALLAGSLPLARGLAPDPAAGAARWALAGAFGAALGPAAGGALTEAFDWRAIFLAQAPIAALALAATVGRVRVGAPEEGAGRRLHRLGANLALALVSGALVGALFLVVLLLIDVWGFTPLRAAAVVTAIPAATLAGRALSGRLGTAAAAAAGSLLLVGGLAGVAFVPASGAAWVVAGLALCGLGVGLAIPGLSGAALWGSRRPAESATWSIAARHVGLVAGLLVLSPLLAHDLSRGASRAERAGTAQVLDAELPVGTKVPLAVDLVRTIRRTPSGSLPDFAPDFARRRAAGDVSPALTRLERTLDGTVRDVVTRGFRRAFLLAALLALPVLAAVARVRRARPLVPAALAGAALLAAELGAGGLAYGAVPDRDACRAPPRVSGEGLDPAAQRLVLRGLDTAACHLGKSREDLVLDVAQKGLEAERWLDRIRAGLR